MEILVTHKLNLEQKSAILNLWNGEYPENLVFKSASELDNYLKNLLNPTHYFLHNSNKIVGWAFTFERENEKWFAIIVSEKYQKKGFGKKLLDKLQLAEPILNGWVIDNNLSKKNNGEFYKSPLQFYLKNGFEITNERIETVISAVKIIYKQ